MTYADCWLYNGSWFCSRDCAGGGIPFAFGVAGYKCANEKCVNVLVGEAAAPLSAPQPEPSSHPDRPNYCCENGDFGDNHECRKQPGTSAEVASAPSFYDEFKAKHPEELARAEKELDESEASSPSPTPCDCEFKNGFHVCAATLNDATAKGDWVKVTPDSLPEFSTEVFVSGLSYGGKGPRFIAIAVYEENGWWQFDRESEEYSAKMYPPTHWRELPSPPEENRDE